MGGPLRGAALVGLGMLGGCVDGDAMLHHAVAFDVDPSDVELGNNGADLHVMAKGGPMLRFDLVSREELSRFSPGAVAGFGGVGDAKDDEIMLALDDELVLVSGDRASTLWREDAGTRLLGGALLDGEAVTLQEHVDRGCEVRFGEASPVPVDAELCLSSEVGTAVAPGPGAFLVTNGVGSWSVRADGTAVYWDAPGDFVLWEPLLEAAVTAELGRPELRATMLDGTELWATTVGEPVLSVDVAGEGGDLLLATSPGAGARLIHLDAVSGDAVRAVELPAAPRVLSAGAVGVEVHGVPFANAVAIGFPDEVHVFGLRLGTSGAVP